MLCKLGINIVNKLKYTNFLILQIGVDTSEGQSIQLSSGGASSACISPVVDQTDYYVLET